MAEAVVAIGTAIGAEAIAVEFVFANIAWTNVAARFAFSMALSLVSESLQESPAQQASPLSSEIASRKQLIRVSAGPRRVVYGAVGRISGNLLYVSNGTDGSHVHFVIALAGHQCHAINDAYLGDEKVGDLDADGNVITGRFAGHARIRKYLGTADQVTDPLLAAECPEWGEKNRPLKGVCYVYLRIRRSRDVFRQGIPSPRFDIEGKADILDVRTGVVGYTVNAALCTLDFILWKHGFASGLDEVNQASWITAANVSDEDVALPAAAGGGTQKRYAINGSFTADVGRAEVLDQMRQAMAGAAVYEMGLWYGDAGAADTPVMDISERDMRGPYRIRPRVADDRVYNAVKGTYTETEFWSETDFPPVTNATYEAQDGGERIYKDVKLPFEIDPYRAQRLAKIDLDRHRQGIVVELPLRIKGLKLRRWNIVRLSLAAPGFVNKLFRIVDWKFNLFGGADLVAEEYADAIYAWSSLDATVVDPAPDTTLPNPFVVTAPQLPALSSGAAEIVRGGDGTLTSRIRVTLAPPADPFVRWVNVRFKKSAAAIWEPGQPIPSEILDTWLSPVEEGADYDVSVRYENGLGVRSDWVQAPPHTVIGKSAKPGAMPWASLSDGVLRWGLTAEQDLAGAIWRWQPGLNQSWGDANPLHEGLLQAPYPLVNRPSGQVTLLGKLVDVVGNESETSVAIATDFGDPLVANVIYSKDCHADGFTGARVNATVDGGTGDLMATADASPLAWFSDLAGAWTTDSAPAWRVATYKAMSYEDQISVGAQDVGAQITGTSAIDAGSYGLDYRRDGAAPAWSDDLHPAWTTDESLAWTFEDWQVWPGSLIAERCAYQFRVRTSAGATRGRISALLLQLDVPDIGETLANVALAGGGTRLPLTKSYRAIKTVNLTLQADGGSARTLEVIDKDAALGPMCRGFDSTHTGAAAHADAIVQGY